MPRSSLRMPWPLSVICRSFKPGDETGQAEKQVRGKEVRAVWPRTCQQNSRCARLTRLTGTSILQSDGDGSRSSIERILHHFLNCRRRAMHNLTGSDAVDHRLIQTLDAVWDRTCRGAGSSCCCLRRHHGRSVEQSRRLVQFLSTFCNVSGPDWPIRSNSTGKRRTQRLAKATTGKPHNPPTKSDRRVGRPNE